MKKKIIKWVTRLLLLGVFLLAAYYNLWVKKSPSIDTVAKVDIYNDTYQELQDIKILCNLDHPEDEYCITIPEIAAKERIIVVFSSALAGNYDTGVYISCGDNIYEISGLEKGYFGMHAAVRMDGNEVRKDLLYLLPWIPDWSEIYSFDNMGNLVRQESKQAYQNRMKGTMVDYQTKLDLLAEESLTTDEMKYLKKYYEWLSKYDTDSSSME